MRTHRSCSGNGSWLRARGTRPTVQQENSYTLTMQTRQPYLAQTTCVSHRHAITMGMAALTQSTTPGRGTLTATTCPQHSTGGNLHSIQTAACPSHRACSRAIRTAIKGVRPPAGDPARSRATAPRSCQGYRTSTEACPRTSARGRLRVRPLTLRSSPCRSETR